FNNTGKFSRPYLGVSYTIISQRSALLNDVPQGAFVQDVIAGSAADEAGILTGDIITEIDGKKISDESESVAILISEKKIGDKVSLSIFRDGQTLSLNAKLKEAPNE
ncbi:MAG: PDZ domain-containing protein, partial [Candidatus Omnitrophica bacterium]|nr:PDZ domain-containing protein [Candidatus Omnitrophota bacterium]